MRCIFLLAIRSLPPPLFAWYIGKLNTHPIARGRENVAAIKGACDLLDNEKKIVIFPEGFRSPDGEFQKAQTGVGMLVLRTNAPVTPIYIHGTFDVWGRDRKKPRLKGKTACVFGSPLDFSHLKSMEKKEAHAHIANTIMEAIANLKDWYLKGAKGNPP